MAAPIFSILHPHRAVRLLLGQLSDMASERRTVGELRATTAMAAVFGAFAVLGASTGNTGATVGVSAALAVAFSIGGFVVATKMAARMDTRQDSENRLNM